MTNLRATSLALLALVTAIGCGGTSNPPVTTPSAGSASTTPTAAPPSSAIPPVASIPVLASRPVPLPGASGMVFMDYLAADRSANRVWVPAGGLGSVVVIEGASGATSHIDGFTTAEVDRRGHKLLMGPTAVALADGVVFIGNRGDGTICAVDPAAMKTGACYPLAHGSESESADGLAYVASAKELWVTLGAPALALGAPPDASVIILDAGNPQKLTKVGKVKLGGSAEGYALDDARGVFYTSNVDANRTVGIDVKTKKVTVTWNAGCDNEGPRGLALDKDRGFLFVACSNGVAVLDAGHDGAVLSRLDAGGGVDAIDYLPAKRQLFVAAADEGHLTVASVDDHGATAKLATGKTAKGARTVVADSAGHAYVADPQNGRVLVFDAVP